MTQCMYNRWLACDIYYCKNEDKKDICEKRIKIKKQLAKKLWCPTCGKPTFREEPQFERTRLNIRVLKRLKMIK